MVKAYEQALRIRPEDVQCWTAMARGYRQLNGQENEIAAYQHALGLRPNDIDLWIDLAGAYPQSSKELCRVSERYKLLA